MKSRSSQFRGVCGLAAALCAAALVSGCTLSNQEPPPISGPSGFAQSVRVTAAPQVLPRDGSSMSTISVAAFNADGSPRANLRLRLSADFGTLSLTEVLTGSNGTATVVYVAPSLNESVPQSTVTIIAVPIEAGDLANANAGSVRIAVTGPDVPVASFRTMPDSSTAPGPKALVLVTFDASDSNLGNAKCGSACTYMWNFGDGSTGNAMVVQHQYSSSGVFNATLTVTANSGTSNSITKPVLIAPPDLTNPEFSFAACATLVPKCMTFTDNSVPDNGVTITSYFWDFSDGSSPVSTQAPTIDHTFPANPNPATYNVRLRLTDNMGRVSTTTRSVQVP